jgi:predicted tellurium resistance membrane protein TerC
MGRIRFLQTGLAFVLAFIGVKMLLEIGDIKLSSKYSLIIIALILTVTIIASITVDGKKNKS